MSTVPSLLSTHDFAAKIRAKYPGFYDSLGDDELTSRIVQKYPEYKSVVNFGLSPETRQAISENPPSFPDRSDQGVKASLKRTGKGLIHLPGALYDAFTKPPQNEDEKRSLALGGYGNLGLQRIIGDPLEAESQKADALRQQAQLSQMEGQTASAEDLNHQANMHRIGSVVPLAGPMAANIVDRFRTGDTSGAVTDLATAVAGPKLAEGVVGGMAKVAGKIAPQVAERMYQSALKPSTSLPFLKRSEMVQTGLKAGIPVSPAGVEKLGGLIDDLNSKIADQINTGSKAGATIDPQKVASRIDQVRPQFLQQVNPASDLEALDAAKQEFLDNQHIPQAGAQGPLPAGMTAAEAQAVKQGTYKQLKSRAYGELKSATVEAQKALARGIKEELESQFPEIKGMNAEEARYIGLDQALERAMNRIGNHQLVGIGTPIVAGAAAGATHSGPIGIIAGTLKAVLDDPIVKSRLAIALNKAGVPPWLSSFRMAQYSNALAQSQPNHK